jgi:hypothetical protein
MPGRNLKRSMVPKNNSEIQEIHPLLSNKNPLLIIDLCTGPPGTYLASLANGPIKCPT